MATSMEDWLDAQCDRLLSTHFGQADAVKLVVTFTVGIGAAFLAAVLQVADEVNRQLWWNVGAFAGSALLALAVIASDRLRQPDHGQILEDAVISKLTSEDLLLDLRLETLAVVRFNDRVLGILRRLALVQVLLAVASWTISLWWLATVAPGLQ